MKFRRPEEIYDDSPDVPVATAEEVRLDATATEVVLSHEEQKSMSIVWRPNEARCHELLSSIALSNDFCCMTRMQ